MLRIGVSFRLSIGFLFILRLSGASTGDMPAYQNAYSTQIFPGQTIDYFNQFDASSSYPVPFSPQALASTTLPQSVSIPTSANNIKLFPNTDISNRIQPEILSNGFTNSFQPSVASASLSPSSTARNTVLATTNGVTPIRNANEASTNSFTVLSPSVEALAQSLSQALSSIPAIQNYLTVPISGSVISNIFYTKSIKLLTEYGYSDPQRLASIVSQPVNLFDVLTFPLLFKAFGRSISKFLSYDGVEIPPNISQLFASSIEDSIDLYFENNVDSLVEALWYGSANFINRLGFDFLEKSDYLTQIFVNELIALKFN